MNRLRETANMYSTYSRFRIKFWWRDQDEALSLMQARLSDGMDGYSFTSGETVVEINPAKGPESNSSVEATCDTATPAGIRTRIGQKQPQEKPDEPTSKSRSGELLYATNRFSLFGDRFPVLEPIIKQPDSVLMIGVSVINDFASSC